MRRLLRTVPLLSVLVLVAAACGEEDQAIPPTAIDTLAPSTTAPPSGDDTTETEAGAGGATADPAVDLVDTGLDLDEPIAMVPLPGSDLLLVAERSGVVRVVAPSGTGPELEVVGDPVIDVTDLVGSTDGERGLLGLATDESGDLLYLSYTEADEGASRVDEYRLDRSDDRSPRAVTSSRRELLAVPQPFANHNGGHLVVAPDGSLLLGLGDGGSADDPDGRAQDPDSLLGKMIRIDPATGGDGEVGIHALGVRNPWRFSFDRETGDLWIADVGQNRFEEITLLRAGDDPAVVAGAGANLGWDLFEGAEAFDDADPDPRTADGPFTDPVFTYGHDAGCSITGGVVYRGAEIPELDGWYLFGDLCDPSIRALRPSGDGAAASFSAVDLGVESDQTVSFAEDADGEVYVLSLEGAVSRLVDAAN